MTQFFTTRELADYLNITPLTIRRKTLKGDIPYFKIGNRLRFDKEQIDAWLKNNAGGNKVHILVVDDEPVVGRLFESSLKTTGYALTVMTDSRKAVEVIGEQSFSLIFLDLKMPGIDGAELFRIIREKDETVPVAIITGFPDSTIMARAMEYGPFTILKKPFVAKDILTTITSLAEKR